MCQMFAGQAKSNYEYQTRSLRLNGQCTSIRLEKKFWQILDEIAAAENTSTPLFISQLHSEVVDLHGEAKNFSSLLRCSCLVHLEKTLWPEAAPDEAGSPDADSAGLEAELEQRTAFA